MPTHPVTTRVPILPPLPKHGPDAGLADKAKAFGTWVQSTRPVRAIMHWNESRGGLLAGGMAYAALFSFFAALWVFFSIAGIVLSNRPDLIDAAGLEDLLQCPLCGDHLSHNEQGFECLGCKKYYPVEDGIIDLRV